MPQTFFPLSETFSASLNTEQRETLRFRSAMMELIAGTRHVIAQSRALLAEADSLITRSKLSKLGTLRQSERSK
jgi:hypothetical protein